MLKDFFSRHKHDVTYIILSLLLLAAVAPVFAGTGAFAIGEGGANPFDGNMTDPGTGVFNETVPGSGSTTDAGGTTTDAGSFDNRSGYNGTVPVIVPTPTGNGTVPGDGGAEPDDGSVPPVVTEPAVGEDGPEAGSDAAPADEGGSGSSGTSGSGDAGEAPSAGSAAEAGTDADSAETDADPAEGPSGTDSGAETPDAEGGEEAPGADTEKAEGNETAQAESRGGSGIIYAALAATAAAAIFIGRRLSVKKGK